MRCPHCGHDPAKLHEPALARKLDAITLALISLDAKLETLMTAVSDFAAKQNAHNDASDAAIAGLATDIQALNDEIAKLQNSQGQLSPEDQASLDAIEARGATIQSKLEALDALTPPTPPNG